MVLGGRALILVVEEEGDKEKGFVLEHRKGRIGIKEHEEGHGPFSEVRLFYDIDK